MILVPANVRRRRCQSIPANHGPHVGELRIAVLGALPVSLGASAFWVPAVDLVRDDGNLVLRADIPGIKPEEVKIEIEDDLLTVSGEHEESKEEKDEHFVRREVAEKAGKGRREGLEPIWGRTG